MSRESRLRQRVHDMGPRSKARWGMLLGTLAHTSSGKHMWVSSRRFASLGLLPHTEVCFEDPPHLDVDCTLTDDDEAVCAMIAQKLSLGGPRSRVRIRGADAARLARLADVASRQAGLFCRIIQPASGDAAEAVTGVGNADAGTRLPTDRLRRCFRLLRYDLPAPMAPLHLWERSRSAVTAEELAGAGSNGVDNTGNVCMWVAEEVLAGLVLHRRAELARAVRTRVVELGAGMAGMAGLAAAAVLTRGEEGPAPEVVLTDGNPRAAVALAANADECRLRAGGAPLAPVRTCELKWDREQDPCAVVGAGGADLVLAADCLFFEDYHEDLAATVARLISPARGVAWMLAPRRGGSLERFVERARPLFGHMSVHDRYDGRVEDALAAQRESGADFDADTCAPVLVVLAHEAAHAAPYVAHFSGSA